MDKVSEDFRDWWMNGGSEAWAKALDAEGGTVKALEMVFNSGANAGRKALYKLQDDLDRRDGCR